MPELSGRTENFTDSVIRRMTRVSLQYGAVNLSQGFPDFDPPKEILDRLAEVAHEDYHQYSITWGAQNFREALAEKLIRRHPHVFGDAVASTPGQVLRNWEAIKSGERGKDPGKSALDGVASIVFASSLAWG